MTYPVGHVTTAISYSGGYAYVQQAANFNVFGESLGEETIIPPGAQGSVLGKTWKITHTYTSVNGLLWADAYGSGGGLPAETVTHTYNNDGQPYGLATTSYGYVQGTTYSAYNQVAQVQLGFSTSYATVTDGYDAHTGDLTDQLVTRSTTTPATIDETAYTYDLSGNITHQTETRSGSSTTAETQCYTYDTLDRLTTAWTTASTATNTCDTTPTSSDHSTVGDGITGGTYWTSWTYDDIGNRLTQTQHTVSGTGSDILTTSGWSSSQPNTMTGTTTTGGTTSYTYDAAGNTQTRDTSIGDQTLLWNNAEQLTSVSNSTTGTATSYIYDADGNLLLQIDPAATTLYLGSEQITLNDAAGTATGVRYYGAPGGTTIIRTGTGTNYGFELAADQHGTNSLYLDYTAQNPTWRQFDPYGNPRGTTISWADNRTFLNKATDTSTGLTDIGAREYDPTTGRFISLDPELEATSPQELGGYTYAGDNPVSESDPTGLCMADICGVGTPKGNVVGGSSGIITDGPVDPGYNSAGYCHNGSCGRTHYNKTKSGTAHTGNADSKAAEARKVEELKQELAAEKRKNQELKRQLAAAKADADSGNGFWDTTDSWIKWIGVAAGITADVCTVAGALTAGTGWATCGTVAAGVATVLGVYTAIRACSTEGMSTDCGVGIATTVAGLAALNEGKFGAQVGKGAWNGMKSGWTAGRSAATSGWTAGRSAASSTWSRIRGLF
ncbi:RHS repeat-associated core domain-containing protein [Streptomyces sp. NBC_00343]|uniref:RHS repeat-associated core domain-containing protein n=1 Tax=Streptomyces sp. NBC_00343 TaxID=2975719 RepID=UPI002E2CA01F|nr:RHS repeat-associated core domain-containing protein [Streptomyces sp. NBC_00343]